MAVKIGPGWCDCGGLYEKGNVYSNRNDERSAESLPQPNTTADHEDDEEEIDRGQWGNKVEFILSCIGLSVGLGNVWRFPYLAYKNGGAAFVIAYLILQIVIGKPMYFMELVMGQFSGRGPTGVWAMNPAAKGIGMSMALISLDVAIYYNVIMAYTLYYFFASMQTTLPWTECKPEWIDCIAKRFKFPEYCTGNETFDLDLGECRCTGNSSIDLVAETYTNCTQLNFTGKPKSAAEFFFYEEVIQRSAGLEPENLGYPLWWLVLCMLLSWVVVVLCLIKGVKSSGKVVYFTATFPYVILIILLIRGALLDGAIDGVIYFIVPVWEKLLDLDVWVAAAGQMFFSLSVSFGGIIMFGSYNKFKNNVYADALLISVMDVITSIIAGFVIFTTFGGMARSIGAEIDEVAEVGYGLAFVAYPEALSNFPIPQLWSVLFFFMLFTLGLDSEFGLMETVLTCIQDEFPKTRKYKGLMCVGLGLFCFAIALPVTCPGGDYIVTLMDHYGADFSVLFIAACEAVAVAWVYGVLRFWRDINYMLGYKSITWPFWAVCWVSIPILIGLLFLYRMINYKSPKYPSGDPYPEYAQGLGWTLAAVVLCPVPIYFLYAFFTAEGGFLTKLKTITTPTSRWRPNDGSKAYMIPQNGMNMENMKTGIDAPYIVSD
ncbi:hypothetical protein LOTGIDRAFT_235858 [Lottia gigantea]|uniref:Transporter n=1 Tax=Lottia gigantea TaxID=225164 RepID=V3ZLM2_LOTGI|nr:hypothetical protein LOTGIDRAFT_235858 [Lottia gigantea]ESO85197.1 hypothetical protein LOTGIDRAFT_235858 [Lottia gigantea]